MAHDHRSERPTRRGRLDDSGGDTEGGNKLYYHLTLLAENAAGYRNLIQLASLAFMEGYYYKPRMDWELLSRHSEGLIATTGCLGGHVLQSMMHGDEKGALEKAARLQDIFGRDNLFVELQDHGLAEQRRTNPKLIELAKKLKAPLLATNDSHYTHREDHESHGALLCVQTGSLLSDPKRFKFEGTEHYLKTAAEMRYLFREVPVGVRQHAVDRRAGEPRDRVRQAAAADVPGPGGDGRRQRVPPATSPTRAPASGGATTLAPEVEERLAYELKTINDMGFASYFLIVWDLIKHARDSGIRVGPGRGSAAGCAVAYSLLDHRPRPDQVRPAVRALPQPEPHLDARHRHGLRLPVPGRDDPLRRRALRPRPRRPDHHVRHDQGPQRGARRSPRARLPVRRRRQAGQGDAAAGDGSRHPAQVLLRAAPEVRRRLQGGRRPAGDVRHRARRRRRSSTSPRGSRD